MVSGNRDNCILKLRKRPFPIEKGVSLCREEPLLASKKRPLHLQTIVFTPLSIRRGVGGEAVDGLVVSLYRLGGGFFFHIEIFLLHDRNTILCVPL